MQNSSFRLSSHRSISKLLNTPLKALNSSISMQIGCNVKSFYALPVPLKSRNPINKTSVTTCGLGKLNMHNAKMGKGRAIPKYFMNEFTKNQTAC